MVVVLALRALFAFMSALFVLVLAEPTILAIRSFVVASHLITLVTLYSKVQRNKFLRGKYDSSSGYKEYGTYIRKRSSHTQQTIYESVRRCGGVVTADGAVDTHFLTRETVVFAH